MRPTPRADRDSLTVFVISTGEDVLGECLAALERQTVDFRLQEIVDVYPMSAAFQAMPDRCETSYFVQVDADMILDPEAVGTLYEAMLDAGHRTCTVSGQLHEEGFGLGGAVKCWRRSLFKLFRFRDVRTVDRDLYRRTRRWGLTQRHLERQVGIHRPRHSPESGWLKAKGDAEKWRFLGRGPEQYALPVLRELLDEPPAEPERLLGTLLGALTTEPRLSRSKDLRHERTLRSEVLRLLHPSEPSALLLEPERRANLPKLFAGAYVSGQREPLAAEIAASFGGHDGVTSRLLELTSR